MVRQKTNFSNDFKRDPTRTISLIARYERQLVSLFEDHKKEVLAAIDNAPDTFTHKARDQPIKIDISKIIPKLEDLASKLEKPAREIADDIITKSYQKGVSFSVLVLQRAGIDTSETLLKRDRVKIDALKEENMSGWDKPQRNRNGDITGYVHVGGLKNVADEGVTKIDLLIRTGLETDQKYGELVDDIATVLDEDITRARMIARTEVMRAVDKASHERYKDAGVEREEWLTVLDEKECEQCAELDGQVFDIDDGPRPPEDTHPDCRCIRLPKIVVPGMEE